MKRYLAYIALLFPLLVLSQAKSGSVTYGLKLEFPADFLSGAGSTDLAAWVKNAERVKFSLNFNEDEALFFLNRFTGEDLSGPVGLSGANAIYYLDRKTNTSYRFQHSADFGDLMVKTGPQAEWVLINETKTINGYLCYKAQRNPVENANEEITDEIITAWYCPDIKFSYGPKGYGGLPGLILELQRDKNVIFIATKINIPSRAAVKIVKPVATVVTNTELNKMYDDLKAKK